MKTQVRVLKEVDIKTLEVKAGVRYWEDAEVNGVDDIDGALIPFRQGDLWCPVIDIDSGVIKDWPKGTKVSVHFKVCDAGSYFLKDENGDTVLSIEDDYVPDMLCPKENGYGDYIIMDIDENGKIDGWRPDIRSFQKDED